MLNLFFWAHWTVFLCMLRLSPFLLLLLAKLVLLVLCGPQSVGRSKEGKHKHAACANMFLPSLEFDSDCVALHFLVGLRGFFGELCRSAVKRKCR